MSFWKILEIGLDVANIAVSLDNAAKIQQIQQQGVSSALIQAVLNELRNQVFSLKQKAEEILEKESESLLLASCAIRILELQLDESRISPEIFQELTDKDYAAKTIRLIRTNSARILEKLPLEERGNIQQVAEAVLEVPKYEFYIQNYSKGIKYKTAAETLDKFKDRQGCLINGLLFLYLYPGLMVPFVVMVDSGVVLGIILFIGWVIGFAQIIKWQNPRGYKDAKKFHKKEPDFDLEKFKLLDNKYNGVEDATRRLAKARIIISDFFGENTISQPGSATSSAFDPLIASNTKNWATKNDSKSTIHIQTWDSLKNSIEEPNDFQAEVPEAKINNETSDNPPFQSTQDRLIYEDIMQEAETANQIPEKGKSVSYDIQQKAAPQPIPMQNEMPEPNKENLQNQINLSKTPSSFQPIEAYKHLNQGKYPNLPIRSSPSLNIEETFSATKSGIAEKQPSQIINKFHRYSTALNPLLLILKQTSDFASSAKNKFHFSKISKFPLLKVAISFLLIVALGVIGFFIGGTIYNITSVNPVPTLDVDLVMTQAVQTAMAEIVSRTATPTIP